MFLWYETASPIVKIAGFSPQLVVITSKQRPRRLTIHGEDGENYDFLLKGHEDLRQDERVMQVWVFFALGSHLMIESIRNIAPPLGLVFWRSSLFWLLLFLKFM